MTPETDAQASRHLVTRVQAGDRAAIDALTPLLRQSERIGGSRAQHDLIEFTLLKACLNAERLEEARQLLKARRSGAMAVSVAGAELLH